MPHEAEEAAFSSWNLKFLAQPKSVVWLQSGTTPVRFVLRRTMLGNVISFSLACGLHTAFDIGLRTFATGPGPR